MKSALLILFLVRFTAFAEQSQSPERVAKEFFAYLSTNHRLSTGLDISSDASAQDRFLSTDLRQSLAAALKYNQRHHPQSGGVPIPPPDNSSFLLAWDPPTKFVVIRVVQTPFTAIVAGQCVWGPLQQYSGEVRPTFFLLVFERGAWRISDIQAAKAKFNRDMSLRADLVHP